MSCNGSERAPTSYLVEWVQAPLLNFRYTSESLWKTELFEDVSTINGVLTALRIKMKDLMMDGSTKLYLSAVEYDTSIPDSLFDPPVLPQIATHECWKAYCSAPTLKK
jgi:hypothetical protein